MSSNRRPVSGRASLTLYLLNALVKRCLGLIDCFADRALGSSSYVGMNPPHAELKFGDATFSFGCLNLLKEVVKPCFGLGNLSLNCANDCFKGEFTL